MELFPEAELPRTTISTVAAEPVRTGEPYRPAAGERGLFVRNGSGPSGAGRAVSVTGFPA
ncbi:hypothetical protein Nans01_42830 [Nocardiopsis ansamitocini]|uniref:Uncharacterized protein n=1 Tax=Nocardiopsis ansamitocini TaxID=1670832 RepID=A0A9W6PAC6_9ACTN|nr:hypothetical protein Nans01_42830 [Nocardiopsis ansamitocini]